MRKALARLGAALAAAVVAASGFGWSWPTALAENPQAADTQTTDLEAADTQETDLQLPDTQTNDAQAGDAQAADAQAADASPTPSDASASDNPDAANLTEDQLYARSAILIQADTGDVIFEKDADEHMYPASTTKILTVLLGLMQGDLNASVTMDGISANVEEGSSVIPLQVGETVNFKDLLYATMVRSGNDGANLIAETVSGSIEAFVDLMNQTAQSLGCKDTHFANPNGLQDENHYTTARDMAIIARAAMQNEEFQKIAKTYTYSLPKTNLSRSRVLIGTDSNWLNPSGDNEFFYKDATGIKTGHTEAAGYCYVGSAERDGVKLISVVFNTTAPGRWLDSKRLMEYGFSQFVSVTPAELYEMNPTVIETSGYSMDDSDIGRLQLDIEPMADTRTVHIVATKTEVETLARNLKQSVIIEYSRDNREAPVTKGEVFGTLTYYPTDGGSAVTYQLVASRTIARRENAPKSIAEIEAATYADPNPFPPLSPELALLAAIPCVALFLLVRFIWRRTHKNSRRSRKQSRVPKPGNRYFR